MDRDELVELLDGKDTFSTDDEQEFWHGGTNSIGNNSDYSLHYANEFGNLSEAPCLCTFNGDELIDLWVYRPYQVRSFLSELLENTTVTFTKLK